MRELEEFLWENRRLFRAAASAADRALEPLGIDASTRALLEFLARESRPVGLSELARKRSVSRQHIHQSLQRLPNARWIDKLPDPRDARSVLLSLSPEGRKFWSRIRGVDRLLVGRLSRQVETDELTKATKVIRQVREILEKLQ